MDKTATYQKKEALVSLGGHGIESLGRLSGTDVDRTPLFPRRLHASVRQWDAHRHPHYAAQITAAAKSSFLSGDQWAYAAGVVAILLGMVLDNMTSRVETPISCRSLQCFGHQTRWTFARSVGALMCVTLNVTSALGLSSSGEYCESHRRERIRAVVHGHSRP